MRKIEIGPNDAGQRLDRLIGKWLPKATWSEVQKWIRKKYVKVNGKRVTDARLFLGDGDVVELFLSDETFASMQEDAEIRASLIAMDIQSWIVAETEDYLVVNKPAGILSHPAEDGIPDLATAVQQYLGTAASARFRPSPAGRLDRNTTGLVVFAKTYAYQKLLAEAVRKHEMNRRYLAVVHGRLTEKQGVIEGYLEKHEEANQVTFRAAGRSEGVTPAADGVYAKTKYRVLGYYRDLEKKRDEAADDAMKTAEAYTLVELELVTGRSHQIRVGLASLGHPIVGDPKYGRKKRSDWPRHQLLHCYQLTFMGEFAEVRSQEIDEFLALRGMDQCGIDPVKEGI